MYVKIRKRCIYTYKESLNETTFTFIVFLYNPFLLRLWPFYFRILCIFLIHPFGLKITRFMDIHIEV